MLWCSLSFQKESGLILSVCLIRLLHLCSPFCSVLYHTLILCLVLLFHGGGTGGGWEVKRSDGGCRNTGSLRLWHQGGNNRHDDNLVWTVCMSSSGCTGPWCMCTAFSPLITSALMENTLKKSLRLLHLFTEYNHSEVFFILKVNNCKRIDWVMINHSQLFLKHCWQSFELLCLW